MNFETLLKKSTPIHTDGVITIPPMYTGKVNFIIPDKIVDYCIDHYGLLNNKAKVIDPMCGVGTIPRIINNRGGDCLGIEIDSDRFHAARQLPHFDKIKLGDYSKLEIENHAFNCLFTSMPFDWFKNETCSIDDEHANRFIQLLKPDGFVLLDSIPFVQRDNEQWPVATRQCAYLTAHGFTLTNVMRFVNGVHEDCTNESVIMHFSVTPAFCQSLDL